MARIISNGMRKQDIKNLSLPELEKEISALGFRVYISRQLFHWLYQKRVKSFSAMPNIAKANIAKLEENFFISDLNLLKRIKSKDATEKFLFGLLDNEAVETVFIPAKNRNTLCLSSQVGCKFKCAFCASGKNFVRHLSVSEITGQLSKSMEITKKNITHVVFMGIGEPLDNYINILSAIRIFNSSMAFNIGARKITISTCGIIPAIEKLISEDLQFELSVSLHSADNDLRSSLMPINKKYPLDKLIPALCNYIKKTKRQVTFEYILLKNINSSIDDADKLSRLLSGMNCKLNLIAFNMQADLGFAPPPNAGISAFKNRLLRNGIQATIRVSRGEDIQAACGQLRICISFIPPNTK